MNFKKFKEIREAVSTFDDAEFDSLLNESTVLVKNHKGNIYSIPFQYNENGNIIFSSENAKMLEKSEENEKEPTLKAIITGKVRTIKESLKSFFESDETEIDASIIAENLDYIKLARRDSLEKYKNNESISNQSMVLESEEFSRLSDSEKEVIRKFKNSFKQKNSEYNMIKNEFFENGKLFQSSGKIKRTQFLNPLKVAELYSEKKEIRQDLESQYDIINTFYETIEKQLKLNSNEREILFTGINLFNESDFKTELAKNLVILKRKVNSGIDISDLARKVNNLYNETFKDSKDLDYSRLTSYEEMISTLTTDSNSESNTFKFLKFKIGVYSAQDLATLRSEFDQVIKNCYGMSREALMNIQDMRDKVDFMLKTGRIDDEQVGEIINIFNTSYGEIENPNVLGNSEWSGIDGDEDEDEDYDSDMEEDYYGDDEEEEDSYDYDGDEESDEYEYSHGMDDSDEDYYPESIEGPTDLNSALQRAKEKVAKRKEEIGA